MARSTSKVDIAAIARYLSLEQQIGGRTILFLGARAGLLFRNDHLYELLEEYGIRNLASLDPLERFGECYRILRTLSAEDIHSLVRAVLQSQGKQPRYADICLAELIQQGIFNLLITTNIDRGLESALNHVNVHETHDFDVFTPRDGDRTAIQFDKRLSFTLLKAFGDFSRMDYVLKERVRYLENRPGLQGILDSTRNWNILLVGIDPVWDEALFPALFPREGTCWYVNEDLPHQESKLFSFLDECEVRHCVGRYGKYEAFVSALYELLVGGEPLGFIIRTSEMEYIEDIFYDLFERGHLLNTPFINVFGAGGIGKTRILVKVRQMCSNKQIPYVWIDAAQSPEELSHQIFDKVEQHRSIAVLVDSIDTADEEQVDWLRKILHRLMDAGVSRLFALLTSEQRLAFEQDWPVAHKIMPLHIHAFDRTSSEAYLSSIDSTLSSEVKETIFQWTRGYPLAMRVIMQAIMYEGLNPHNDQKELVSRIMLQVIDQRVLARIEPTELMIRKDYLSLLSIPRRFNLSLMQELIEQFEPSLKMKSKLQYMGLPKTINQNVGVLAWDRQNVSAGCILSR